jgi:hypothetical protein
MHWPALSADDLYGYQTGYLLSGGALLAGAWLGLRDRLTGADELLTVTPAAPWRWWRSRLAAVAAVAAGAFAVAFATALAISAVRGGRGLPDLRLLADGALAVVLAGWVGVAVGRRSGSRALSLLAAPVWVAACVVVGGWPAFVPDAPPLALHRLAPLLAVNTYDVRSAELGFLPDPLWPHLGYLLGLVLLAGLGLLALAGWPGGRRPGVPLLAIALAGAVLVAAGGVAVVTMPQRLLVLGPDPAGWRPLAEVRSVVEDPFWTYPDDGRARSCAAGQTLTACVYPVYGQGLARSIRDAMEPVAGLFAGLPGVPTRARMVPAPAVHSTCRGTEVQVDESGGRTLGRDDHHGRLLFVDLYLRCALGEYNWGVGVDYHQGDRPPSEALDAVKLWALQASGTLAGEQLYRGSTDELHATLPIVIHARSPELVAAARAMTNLPNGRVRAELAPVWERLRAGRLPLAELPGQRP